MKKTYILLVTAIFALSLSCNANLRLNPATGDDQESVKRIQLAWDDYSEIQKAEKILKTFLAHWEKGETEQAWAMLSPHWRNSWKKEAEDFGLDGEKLFAQGLLPSPGMKKWDAVDTILGPAPLYFSQAEEEMKVRREKNRVLFYSVQADGGYRAFFLVKKGKKNYLEPLGVL